MPKMGVPLGMTFVLIDISGFGSRGVSPPRNDPTSQRKISVIDWVFTLENINQLKHRMMAIICHRFRGRPRTERVRVTRGVCKRSDEYDSCLPRGGR